MTFNVGDIVKWDNQYGYIVGYAYNNYSIKWFTSDLVICYSFQFMYDRNFHEI